MIEALLLPLRWLTALGLCHFIGYALLRLLIPRPGGLSGPETLALSFGVGSLAITGWMLALSALGVPFRVEAIHLPLAGLAAGILLATRFRGRPAALPHFSPASSPPWAGWDIFCLTGLGLVLLYAALRATLFPMWAWDSIATWGFKAKVFYLRQGVDLQGLTAHPYYPNHVPLILTFFYLTLGGVKDHLAQGLFPWWGAMTLALLYALLRRLELSRGQALGVTLFFATSGVTFITHLFIAYADLPLTFYALGAAGLLYLKLRDLAPSGSLPLIALMCAGLSWTKFEGAPLAATFILAAALTLLWLRPPSLLRRLATLAWPAGGILLGTLPWRLYMRAHHIEVGSDHILSFFPHQFVWAMPALGKILALPFAFGVLWWATLAAAILLGRRLVTSPPLFLTLTLAGNLLAILLGYALAPTSTEEFPFYVRATLDRLLLHLAPLAALLVGEGVKEAGGGPGT
ncbi:MAG: hypothetical protein WHT07_05535 [Desulfobaccales bacterium]